jgi:hypothetical protein
VTADQLAALLNAAAVPSTSESVSYSAFNSRETVERMFGHEVTATRLAPFADDVLRLVVAADGVRSFRSPHRDHVTNVLKAFCF